MSERNSVGREISRFQMFATSAKVSHVAEMWGKVGCWRLRVRKSSIRTYMTIQGFTLDVTERGQEVVVHVVYVDRVEEVVKWRGEI